MALTRGISFRRQGSSGLNWAENWTLTEHGMFKNDDNAGDNHLLANYMDSDQQIHEDPPATIQFTRSLSVGSAPRHIMDKKMTSLQPQIHEEQPLKENIINKNNAMDRPNADKSESQSRMVKWFKGKFKKKR